MDVCYNYQLLVKQYIYVGLREPASSLRWGQGLGHGCHCSFWQYPAHVKVIVVKCISGPGGGGGGEPCPLGVRDPGVDVGMERVVR